MNETKVWLNIKNMRPNGAWDNEIMICNSLIWKTSKHIADNWNLIFYILYLLQKTLTQFSQYIHIHIVNMSKKWQVVWNLSTACRIWFFDLLRYNFQLSNWSLHLWQFSWRLFLIRTYNFKQNYSQLHSKLMRCPFFFNWRNII